MRIAATYKPGRDVSRVAPFEQLGGTMGLQGKKIPSAIGEFVVKTKQNAPGLTHQNIADRVVEQFGESNRIDRSSVQRILARAGLQEPSPDGATVNQGRDRKGSDYYQGSDRQLDREHRQTLMAPLLILKELRLKGIILPHQLHANQTNPETF